VDGSAGTAVPPVWRSVRLRRAPPARRSDQHGLLPGPVGVPGWGPAPRRACR